MFLYDCNLSVSLIPLTKLFDGGNYRCSTAAMENTILTWSLSLGLFRALRSQNAGTSQSLEFIGNLLTARHLIGKQLI